jgi:hypothetical protein
MSYFLHALPWRRALCVLAIAAWHFGAGAQAAGADGLPEALRGIKRASGVCRADDARPGAGAGADAAPAVSPDFGCAIPVSALQAMLALPATALVDTRGGAAHQAFHIEGALNLSALDLRSKLYWRGKTVVLIGDGKAELELYSECARLKQLGYKQVAVLRGGMPQWLAENQPVAGRAPAAPQLARLSASEFWLASQSLDNLVVLSKQQSALQGDVAFSLVLPETTPGSLKAALEQHRKERKGVPLSAVVLAVDAGVEDQQIEQLQQALVPLPLLVYADSREALVRQLALQKAIWSAQARGPKQLACGF